MNRTPLPVAGLVALALLGCSRGAAPAAASTPAGPGAAGTLAAAPGAGPGAPGAVKVEFFVMSQCPYGVQVENGVKEALEALGPAVDFRLDFIGGEKDGQFASLHGPDEVTGDLAQLCLAAHAQPRLVPFLACQNRSVKEVARTWEACAREVEAPAAEVKACVEGPEGKALLSASFARAAARGAQASPTMFIGGKPYQGRRGGPDFLRAICGSFAAGARPEACQGLPEPPRVPVSVLTDSRCTECRAERLVGMLTAQLANPALTQLDAATPAGRAALEALPGWETLPLPLVLFDDALEADAPAQAAFGKYLRPLGRWRSLAVGASFLPTCADEGGCAREHCRGTLACRPETPNTLELFVMSQCPYGMKALDAMAEVLRNFKGTPLAFQVHYIASGSAAEGFRSMHGPAEVEEDLRELCAMEQYPQGARYLDYVLCRNQDVRSPDWQRCAVGGIDARALRACAEGPRGKQLLEASLQVSSALGIAASPTWLANGRHRFAALDAEGIRKNLCAHNPKLAGCEKSLSTGGAPAAQCAQ